MKVDDILVEVTQERDRLRRLVFMMAPSFQGGHSRTGGEVAHELGIDFPVAVPALERQAKLVGLDTNDLWPWLAPMRSGKTS